MKCECPTDQGLVLDKYGCHRVGPAPKPPVIGGDKDEHGCLTSAGF